MILGRDGVNGSHLSPLKAIALGKVILDSPSKAETVSLDRRGTAASCSKPFKKKRNAQTFLSCSEIPGRADSHDSKEVFRSSCMKLR